MATSEAKEIKKQETLVRFSIISYKTRLRVFWEGHKIGKNIPLRISRYTQSGLIRNDAKSH